MKIEDIEKKSQECAERLANIAYAGGGHIGQDDLEKAFGNGAEWRINSVWHDASELPNGKKRYIVLLKINDKIRPILWTGAYRKGDSRVVQWAYIEDLLPTKD